MWIKKECSTFSNHNMFNQDPKSQINNIKINKVAFLLLHNSTINSKFFNKMSKSSVQIFTNCKELIFSNTKLFYLNENQTQVHEKMNSSFDLSINLILTDSMT